jgi:hypothetical protein
MQTHVRTVNVYFLYAVCVCVHARIQNPRSQTYRQSSLRSFAHWYACQAFSLHKRLRISARSSISSHPLRTPIHHVPAASRDAPHARCTVLHAPPTSRRTRSPEFCATSIILRRRAPTAHFRDWHTQSYTLSRLQPRAGTTRPLPLKDSLRPALLDPVGGAHEVFVHVA